MKPKYLHAAIVVLLLLVVGTQPALGIKYIPSDTSIGTWNPNTKTYTLTTDVSDTIQIDENDLTLDGDGYTVTGPGTGTNYGVYLYRRTNVVIKNLSVQKFYYGIFLSYDSDYNTLSGNNASNNTFGIYLGYSDENNLVNNKAFENIHTGILLNKSNNNELTDCNAYENTRNGISLWEASYNKLIRNSCSYNMDGNGGGIVLANSSNNNTLKDNKTHNNLWAGVRLGSSRDNKLTNNETSKNKFGMNITECDNNQIYNNNFIDNEFQAALFDSSDNVFNVSESEGGGNYWSDWTSPDADGDGFVDNPYVFTGGQDNLPWVVEDGWLTPEVRIEHFVSLFKTHLLEFCE